MDDTRVLPIKVAKAVVTNEVSRVTRTQYQSYESRSVEASNVVDGWRPNAVRQALDEENLITTEPRQLLLNPSAEDSAFESNSPPRPSSNVPIIPSTPEPHEYRHATHNTSILSSYAHSNISNSIPLTSLPGMTINTPFTPEAGSEQSQQYRERLSTVINEQTKQELRLRSAIEREREDIKEKNEEEIQSLKGQLEQLQLQNDELHRQMLHHSQLALREERRDSTTLETLKQEKDIMEKSYRTRIDELVNRHMNVQSDLARMEADLNAARHENALLQQQVEQIKHTNQLAQQDCKTLKESKNKLNEECESLLKELERERMNASELRVKLAACESEKASIQKKGKELGDRMDDVYREMDKQVDWELNYHNLTHTLNGLTHKAQIEANQMAQRRAQENSEWEARMREMEAQNNILKAAVEAERNRSQSLHSRMELVRQQSDSIQEEVPLYDQQAFKAKERSLMEKEMTVNSELESVAAFKTTLTQMLDKLQKQLELEGGSLHKYSTQLQENGPWGYQERYEDSWKEKIHEEHSRTAHTGFHEYNAYNSSPTATDDGGITITQRIPIHQMAFQNFQTPQPNPSSNARYTAYIPSTRPESLGYTTENSRVDYTSDLSRGGLDRDSEVRNIISSLARSVHDLTLQSRKRKSKDREGYSSSVSASRRSRSSGKQYPKDEFSFSIKSPIGVRKSSQSSKGAKTRSSRDVEQRVVSPLADLQRRIGGTRMSQVDYRHKYSHEPFK